MQARDLISQEGCGRGVGVNLIREKGLRKEVGRRPSRAPRGNLNAILREDKGNMEEQDHLCTGGCGGHRRPCCLYRAKSAQRNRDHKHGGKETETKGESGWGQRRDTP